jgi:hypothetical protein
MISSYGGSLPSVINVGVGAPREANASAIHGISPSGLAPSLT